jgi:hypothetical protein
VVEPNSAGYCEGTPSGFQCVAADNLDPLDIDLGGSSRAFYIPGGLKISYPFTLGTSQTLRGWYSFDAFGIGNANYQFRSWLSATPGGDPLGANCQESFAQGQLYFGQGTGADARSCDLGQPPLGEDIAIRYLNLELVCADSTSSSCAFGAPWPGESRVFYNRQVRSQ